MAKHPIQDEFTNDIHLSKQQRYQRRQKAKGKCCYCSGKAYKSGMCKAHLLKKRTYRRDKEGCKQSYKCLTAKLEAIVAKHGGIVCNHK